MRATDYDCLQGYYSAMGPTYYVLARMLWDTEAERERFRNVELGLQHAELMIEALTSGKIMASDAGKKLMAFRREIAPRNVANVYFLTHKERGYRLFE